MEVHPLSPSIPMKNIGPGATALFPGKYLPTILQL